MQQLDTPVAIENEPSAKGHVMMESKADRRGQQISDDGDLRKQRLETEAALLEASASIGLTNLSDASDIQDEIRVCGGLCGSIYPQCLQITRTHNVNQATFFAPNDMGKMDSKGGLIYERKILDPPKSGWGKLFSFLEGQGIGVPMRIEPERDHLIDPDETRIAIEARSGGAYSMVFFHMGNEQPNAKKALDACRRLESEFGINLTCKDW